MGTVGNREAGAEMVPAAVPKLLVAYNRFRLRKVRLEGLVYCVLRLEGLVWS